MSTHNWATKDPDEVLDYAHDWSARVGSDTISGTPTATVDDESGLVIDGTSTASGVQTVWVSGGTANKTAIITLRLNTAGGRTYEEMVRLPIRNGGGD